MIDEIKTEQELLPFERAKLNVELFATNLLICYGFQQAIADLQECELQLAVMDEDTEIRKIVEQEHESASARVAAAHKITASLDIFCA